MEKIIVTGATGFIGKRFVHNPALKNYNVSILSRRDHEDFETIICDFETDFNIGDAFIGVKTIFHFAGLAHDVINPSENSYLFHKVNLDATVRLLNLAVEYGVNSFIFVSSVKAGGEAISGELMSEDYCGVPKSPYGQIKREAELRVLEIGRKSDIHVSIIRPALVYGPKVKGNLGMMLTGIEKGWFPPLPETRNRRSMIHVDDLVNAILMVSDDTRTDGEIYIATDDVPYSTREIYVAFCHLLGKSVPRWNVPKFLFDILAFLHPRLKHKIDKLFGDECYSSEKLKSLGFKAKLTLKDWKEI